MRFLHNENGAVLIYVALIGTIFVGVAGLAMDAGRGYTLREEIQQAADAAALAGAWQLDGTAAGAARADAAARAVVANSQKWGQTSGGVSIAPGTTGVQFMSTVPASDDAALTFTTAAPFDYIWVQTTATNFDSAFMRIFGGGTTAVSATAVARKGQTICQVTPLFMCLPGGANFDPTQWIGHQVLMKAGGGQNWTNGNWGLLDLPGGNNLQNLPLIAGMIAGTNGLPQCINSAGVDTAPGAKDAVTTAFNVRLDMFENPHAQGFKNQGGYPPAENVVKGKSGNANCNNFTDTARQTRMPRDTAFDPNTRFGNGQWDCLTYWNTNHPGGPAAPSGCADAATTTLTRYETYLHEVTNGIIPNTTQAAGAPAPFGDNGNPTCYTGGPIPSTPTAVSQRINDRRIFTVAGVDCANLTINGNTSNVPVQHYLSMFLTEPAVTSNQGTQEKGDVYMELAGHDVSGGGGLVPIQLREWTELVR